MTGVPVTRQQLRFLPDARRVITKPFIPGDDVSSAGRSRVHGILGRILDLPEAVVLSTLNATRERFARRQRCLRVSQLDAHRLVDRRAPLLV